MPDPGSFIVIFSTAGSLEEASKIANHLVNERIAACVNILPAIHSVYRWKDAVQTDQECLMLIKTEKTKFPEVERAIRQLHSYEVPEVISIHLENGSQGYIEWLENSLKF